MKVVEGTGSIAKLEAVIRRLEEEKHTLADLTDACEEEGTYPRAADMLADALESIDSALDALRDATDEMSRK
ncbi:MAG: hypothetical protein K6E83_05410 [Clostridium sp.]|nr:hypothetical protein [Clostridium sp.]